MLVFAADSILEVLSIDHRLKGETNRNLVRLCSEIVPDVRNLDGQPTLKVWGDSIERMHLLPHASVQLFDQAGNLKESYCARGIPILRAGRILGQNDGQRVSVYSNFAKVGNEAFVEVQVPCTDHDEAVTAFALNKLWRGLIISIAIGICGWIYSGRAILPVVKTLGTLRKFVDDAGHELKTPVTLIEGSIQTLEADLKLHGVSLDVLDIMSRASNRLKNLSTNLLLLAKMDNPDVTLRKALLDVKELVTAAVTDLSEGASNKGIELQVADLPNAVVSADKDALLRLFSNLIENALRYTPTGGKITVFGARGEHNVSVTVEDTGIGIPADCIPHIFDRFYRVDSARSREAGGSGLGLAIAKATVDVHGGSLSVASQPGSGSKFTVTLPLAPRH